MQNDELDFTIEEEMGHNTVERFKGCLWTIMAKSIIDEHDNPEQLEKIVQTIERTFRGEETEAEVAGAYQDALNEFLTEVRAEIAELRS